MNKTAIAHGKLQNVIMKNKVLQLIIMRRAKCYSWGPNGVTGHKERS